MNSSELYYMFWTKYLNFDLKNLRNGRVYTKGQYYRLFTTSAEALALGDPLPDDWQKVERPPFVPFVEQHGKRKEKESLQTTINQQ